MRMQHIGFVLMLCLFLYCHHRIQTTSPVKILTGWQTEEQLFDEVPAYLEEKQLYQPDEDAIEQLQKIETPCQVIVFLGTYCPDSKREVPHFLKVIDQLNTQLWTIRLFCLDRPKVDPSGMREKYQIEFIPTFIIYQNDQEIGRIVERPIMSLEHDLWEICATGSQ
jgi:hypothetical protein